jgi:lipopolysaccharide transport system ATP-binding protein
MSDIAVKLDNTSKFYKLYNSPKDRLKEALHPFKKKFHKRFYALQDVNLEIKKGEILGIVGKNGSGKSTLLKLICEIIQPSSGKVVVNGAVSALLDLSVGLNPEFTGIQNIYFSGTMMGFSRKAMDEKIDDIVTFAEIEDFIHQPLKTYSSGMKARLGFALAINMDPEILILDEVLSVGDELFRRKCYAKMEEFFKSGSTVLYVSHNLNSVNSICSRAIFLDKGELLLEGPPKFVTVYYEKFLFTDTKNAVRLRNEIIQLNKDEENKKRFIESHGSNPNHPIDTAQVKKEEKTQNNNNKIEQEPKQKAFYIPNLKPKSTVVMKNFDIDIFEAYIRTLEGAKVNYLLTNEEYILTFKVKFHLNCDNVSFGVRFKTLKGLTLLATRLNPIDDNIRNIKAYDEFLINCRFLCNLMEGTYFIDLGVVRFENGKRISMLHISDAVIFKVQHLDDNYVHVGTTYLDQKADIIKINKIQ